jgi:glycosyltransferase involved in cell wall biosynthesis
VIFKRLPEDCAAVIPCLNEARTIGPLVREVLRHLPRVIVVDDGSSDGTSAEAKNNGALVQAHSTPLGKGAALKTAFNHAQALGCGWALALDGDGQHRPADIPALLAEAEAAGADLVVGNRMGNAASMPRVRRWVNRWMSRELSEFCGASWPDTQCGLRLLNLQAWAEMNWHADHFEIESELLVRFAFARKRIAFVPIGTHYQGEQSKIRPVRDAWRWFVWWRSIRTEIRHSQTVRPAAAASRDPIAA